MIRMSRRNTSARRKKEVQKSRTVKVPVRDVRRKVNHLSKVIRDYQFNNTRSISSNRIA